MIFPKRFKWLAGLIFLGIVGLNLVSKWYPDIAWFESFDKGQIWWFVFNAKTMVFAGALGLALVFFLVNIAVAFRNCKRLVSSAESVAFNYPFQFLNQLFENYKMFMGQQGRSEINFQGVQTRFFKLFALALSVFFALSARLWWADIYRFIHRTPFNLTEPIFNKDIGFYVFVLPLLDHLQNWVSALMFFGLVITGFIYFSKNALVDVFNHSGRSPIKGHLFCLLAGLALTFALGVQLNIYGLLYSGTGNVYGAGYADIHASLVGYRLLLLAFSVLAVVLLIWGFRRQSRVPVMAFGAVVIVWVVCLGFYPSIVQNFVVAPNEIAKEKPFITHNIKYTRLAYGLDKIQQIPYEATSEISKSDVLDNQEVIQNIRLWNQGPLKQTFKQIQEMRLYYEFNHVDVDRYRINGKLQQVMLSPRELRIDQLPPEARTWVNQHLVYTHGYGVCLSPVSTKSPEGLPQFFVKDIPPKSENFVDISQPSIYFGEATTGYVFTNTRQAEFDFPRGDKNEYTHYKGSGGIQLSSWLKRLMFAWRFSDLKILINQDITNESRLMFDRQITTIVNKITPFILYDRDPYMVVSQEGRLVWFLDGYTQSNKFPYSQPYGRWFNYMRNAVLVTIDAYSGQATFYIKDPSDPIIQTYQKMYPDLFVPLANLPDDLKQHIRYPKDMFEVQAELYKTYHMTNPKVFYNREDLWALPKETYGQEEQPMRPYYTVIKLPNEDKESFILMMPFTPKNKNNMVSWLAIKSDYDQYGQASLFKFPKERTIYGPLQMESRIDQDTTISQKFTLWGQGGSRVIRGNLMIIPFKGAILYAEPIYIQATQSQFPELKRVILAYEDRLVMEEDLESAVHALFNGFVPYVPKTQAQASGAKPTSIQALIQAYNRLKQSAKASNWVGFGEAMEKIEALIQNMQSAQQ